MKVRRWLRDLIIGKDQWIDTYKDYKKSMLLGQLMFLVLADALIFAVVDYLSEIHYTLWVYALMIVVTVIGFFFNRKQHFNLAKHLLLLCMNFAVFCFSARETAFTGSFIHFIPLIVAALALFELKEWGNWIFYPVLSTGLFLLSFTTNFSILPPADFSETYNQLNFLLNILLAVVSVVLIAYFLARLHMHVEVDLQEKKQLLKESEERFRLAVEGINAGIWDWYDIPGKKIWFSNRFYNLMRLSPEDTPTNGEEFAKKFIYPRDLKVAYLHFKEAIHHGRHLEFEFRMRTGKGELRWFLATGQGQWNAAGQATRMVGSIIDITDRKNSEQQVQLQNRMLKKTNEELDRFVYSASHDLRAPLTSLLGLIDLLQRSEDQSDRDQLAHMMQERVHRLDQFIKDIIAYSKNARVEIKREEFFLDEIIQEVLEQLRYHKKRPDVELRPKVPENLRVKSDKTRLTAVLSNLADNALKYHDLKNETPYVELTAEELPENYKILVKDNGPGIEAEYQPHIFQMFYRASQTAEGSGLGLYIVKETLEKMGASIHLESERGQGSTFIINLPK